jgi:flavin reductase (DIM6/NTAB) family NADH-FMN oxidoreductase RutF
MAEENLQAGLDPSLAALRRAPAPGEQAELYRELLSRFPAGVTVVTAFDADGSPRGLTLIAFCGVSLDPPLVLVCIDRGSNTLPAIRRSGGFTVNFVSASSHHVARLMATKSPDKFERIPWVAPEAPEGGPILNEDSAAHLVCRTRQEWAAGDHWVFIGEVLAGSSEDDRQPLVYHRREFVELPGNS